MKLPTAANVFERLPRVLRRHRLMRLWMALTGENPVQLVRIRDDALGYADMSDGFLRLIVIEGNFESDFFRVADSFLEMGGVFLDVGANYGLLSFGLAAKHGNRVDFHLFEPNPTLVRSILESMALYPAMRCTVNQTAVADHEGLVSFFFNDAQTGASHISDVAGHQVRSLTLDHYLDTANIRCVDFLKLDVEGYELAVLRGAERSLNAHSIHAIYFEYFEKWLMRLAPPRELLEFLHSLHFAVCFCRPCDIHPRGSATHTIREELPGHGVPLLPVRGHTMPEMTDLLAVPEENLVGIAD